MIALAVLLAGEVAKAIEVAAFPLFYEGDIFYPIRGRVSDIVEGVAIVGGIWVAGNRPRPGSTVLAHNVDHLKKDGVPKNQMVVIDVKRLEDGDLLTPTQLDQITDALIAKAQAVRDQENDSSE